MYIIKQVFSLTSSIDSVCSNPLEIAIGVLPSLFSENETRQLFITLKDGQGNKYQLKLESILSPRLLSPKF